MIGGVSFAVLSLAAAVMLAIGCALVLSLLLRQCSGWFERLAVAGRSWLLLLLAIAPMLAIALIMLVCLLPSALSVTGLIGDHCFRDLHNHLHLCVQHLPTSAPGAAAWALALFGAGAFVLAMRTALAALLEGRSTSLALRVLSLRRPPASANAPHAAIADDVRWIDSSAPLSVAAGLWRPLVFFSRGFAAVLDPIELHAVLAHERCHARERHGLLRLLALSGSLLHLPSTRAALLRLLALACERRADESAAAEVGDRLRVASAIVRAHRDGVQSATPLVLAYGGDVGSALACRVRALLAPPLAEGRRDTRVLLLATIAAAAASFEIHHAVEATVSYLI